VPPARWLGDKLTARRARRWRTLQERYRKALVTKYRQPEAPPDTARINAARNRVCLAEPGRPTWIGDRMAATQSRIQTAYDLDIWFVWPRLWLVLPDTARTEVRTAADSLAGNAPLIAWGVLYAAIGLWWWPAAPIGVTAALIGWRRGRDSMDAFAHLVESCIDIHARDLAQALGLEAAALTPEIGLQITRLVRKNA
jgi:hypothetical protein